MRDTDGAKTNLTCEVPMHGYKYCMHGLASLLKNDPKKLGYCCIRPDRNRMRQLFMLLPKPVLYLILHSLLISFSEYSCC